VCFDLSFIFLPQFVYSPGVFSSETENFSGKGAAMKSCLTAAMMICLMVTLVLPVFGADTAADDFAGHDAVILKASAELNHEFTYQMSREAISYRIKFLTQKGIEDYGTQSIIYNPSSETVATVEGSVTLPDGTTVKVSDDDIFKKDIVDKGSRRRREIKIAFPSLQPGAVAEYTYTRSYEGIRSVSTWSFQSDLFTAESEVTFIPWHSYPWGYSVTNATVPPEQKETRPGGHKAVTFRRTDIPAMPREKYTMDYSSLTEAIHFYYQDTTHGDYWNEGVTRFFKKNLKDMMESCSEAKDVVKTVCADPSMSDDAKINALFKYVVEEHPPLGLLTKAEAEAVDADYRKDLYKADDAGDLFDFKYLTPWQTNYMLASLIHAACPAADVDMVMYVPWDEGKFNEHLKTIRQFSDRMLRVQCSGRTYWLDPCKRFMPPDMTDWGIKGVKVLVLDEDRAIMQKIPLDRAQDNASTTTAEVTFDLDDGMATIRQTATLNRYDSYDLRSALNYFTEEERKDLLETRAKDVMGEETELVTFSVKNLETIAEPLIVEVECRFPYEFEELGDKLLMDFPGFDRPDSNPFLADTRRNPVFFKYPFVIDQEITYTLPDGYIIEDRPSNTQIADGIVVYNLIYRKLSDNQLMLKNTHMLKGNMMSAEAAGKFRETYNDILEANRKKLVLAEKPVP